MIKYNCPICNKTGLPNFTVQPTICPQCNSDLKPYLLLHSISKSNKLITFTIGGITIIACILALLYYNKVNENYKLNTENSTKVSQLQDSILNLRTNIAQTSQEVGKINVLSRESVIQYRVKKSDCLSMIAEFFYNDWRMYNKIETDNNLKQPYTLKIGQILIIKLKHE
jgi:nucleoid-associated protein YgaU